jgi:hypothetical protein
MNRRFALLLAALTAAMPACSGAMVRPTATNLQAATAEPTATVRAATEPIPPTAALQGTPLVEPLSVEYQVEDEGRSHIPEGQAGDYAHYPPSSGEHYGRVLEWDIYREEIPPEYYVHNLEHGGIVVLYNCPTACPDTEDRLGQFFTEAPPEPIFGEVKIVIGANSRIESKVVALAWGYELDLPEADVRALLAFYSRHVNRGPELVD